MPYVIVLVLILFEPTIWASSIQLPNAAQEGDLIFRRGTEAVSAAVLAADNGEFSHVGMLLGKPHKWQVIHAVPAETKNGKDGVIIDDLDFFLDPKRSKNFAVFKVQATNEQRQKAISFIKQQQDKLFSLKDDVNGTYCTALVWHAYLSANLDLKVKFNYLNIPFMAGEYLLLTPLSQSPYLKRLE